MLSDQYGRIPLDSIIIQRDARQRRQIDTTDIDGSIARRGVLNPVIIDRQNVLIAGERRVESSRKLGLPDIPFRYSDELSPSEREIIELEENIRRKDLPWQDIVRATARIHHLLGGTQEGTAEELGLSQGTCSMYLKVNSALGEERIASAVTVREAYGFLERREQRMNGEVLDELFGEPAAPHDPANSAPLYLHEATLNGGQGLPAAEIARPLREGPLPPDLTVLNVDFKSWAAAYSGQKFNFLHCDFPYGVEVFAGPQMHGAYTRDGQVGRSEGHDHRYDDSPSTFDELLEVFFQHQDRFTSQSAHLMFWYTADSLAVSRLIGRFATGAPAWRFHKFPLIWFKSDNTGVASDPLRLPRHTYEVCLFATKGDRQIVQIVADSYSAPTDTRLHPSTKPEPVLKHFFRMLVDQTSRVLDPTCGSGSSLRAAEALGAKSVLGLEISLPIADAARSELRISRLKRAAAQTVQHAAEVPPGTPV